MFEKQVYIDRRNRLRNAIGSGIVVLVGNDICPVNFEANSYPFRQDSSFLYFFGLDRPGLIGMLDLEGGKDFVFGDDPGEDAVIWTTPSTPLREECEHVGVVDSESKENGLTFLRRHALKGGVVHYLPQYQSLNVIILSDVLGVACNEINRNTSTALIQEVVAQRSVKSDVELVEIEKALDVSFEMHTAAIRKSVVGMCESDVVAMIDGVPKAKNLRNSFSTILTVRGEILHNPFYTNYLKEGDIVVHDSGAETSMGYASDITRTYPVSPKFNQEQRDVYQIVLDAQARAVELVRPGREFRDIHAAAGKVILDGLKTMGVVRGVTEDALAQGVHTLFFPCGLGHLMGLDVHDMEALGENWVGYTSEIKRRDEFGWRNLRLGKALNEGYVITIEPGIYFNPVLTDRWRASGKYTEFVDFDRCESFQNFGGVRVEDDYVVTNDGSRLLGRPIPKAISEIEQLRS
jgi:Xaa-Pro aminopeptidase